jgi:hypothetical protein
MSLLKIKQALSKYAYPLTTMKQNYKRRKNCTWMTPMFEDFSTEFGSSTRPCVCA